VAGAGRLGAAFAGAFLARCSRSGVTPRYGYAEVWWLDRRELKLPYMDPSRWASKPRDGHGWGLHAYIRPLMIALLSGP